jgi:hypothetical protein
MRRNASAATRLLVAIKAIRGCIRGSTHRTAESGLCLSNGAYGSHPGSTVRWSSRPSCERVSLSAARHRAARPLSSTARMIGPDHCAAMFPLHSVQRDEKA